MYQEYSSNGFKDGGFVKVGSIEIKDSLDNIVKLWSDADNRQDWDKGVCEESRVIDSFNTGRRVNYFVSRSSIAPWRDFAFVSDKVSFSLSLSLSIYIYSALYCTIKCRLLIHICYDIRFICICIPLFIFKFVFVFHY